MTSVSQGVCVTVHHNISEYGIVTVVRVVSLRVGQLMNSLLK